jgi:uncharacterized protein YukE
MSSPMVINWDDGLANDLSAWIRFVVSEMQLMQQIRADAAATAQRNWTGPYMTDYMTAANTLHPDTSDLVNNLNVLASHIDQATASASRARAAAAAGMS